MHANEPFIHSTWDTVMKLRTALASAASLMSAAAIAAGPGYLGELDNSSIDIGHTLGSKSTPFNGAFNDVFSFDLLDAGFIKGGLHTTTGLEFGIKKLKATIEGGSLALPETFFVNESGTLNFLLEDLSGGHYTVTVSGTVFGGQGSYGGDIYAVTQAVPEPESLALLLAGVGLVLTMKARQMKALRHPAA
jgi:hypothetical protein